MRNATETCVVVAVSGGIDSVVLLDALVHRRQIAGIDPWEGRVPGRIIVAHFDHGIRSDSNDDERFVRKLAEHYGCEYRSRREELGGGASEQIARDRRYAFLNQVCHGCNGQLITAHHAGDVAETIAINVTRGTGWRGVAVMDNERILRPLLPVLKREIHDYARRYDLSWREDSTNHTDAYLRNRIRRRLQDEEVIWQLAALRARQTELKQAIDAEAARLVGDAPYSRYFFSHCGDNVAVELLRTVFIKETGVSPTIVVRRRILHAIKVARHQTTVPAAEGIIVRFTHGHFVVVDTDKVLS